jgi:hypothetical protein
VSQIYPNHRRVLTLVSNYFVIRDVITETPFFVWACLDCVFSQDVMTETPFFACSDAEAILKMLVFGWVSSLFPIATAFAFGRVCKYL